MRISRTRTMPRETIDFEGPTDEEMRSWHLWGGTDEPFSSKGKWNVVVQDTQNHSTEVYQVDFVVLGLGRFSGIPNIPSFPPGKGPETFHGEAGFSDMKFQSILFPGVELPCTVLYKTERWGVPNYLPWGMPLAYLYLNRFSELLVHKPGEGFLLSSLATILSPLRTEIGSLLLNRDGYSQNSSRVISNGNLPLAKFAMVPKHSFHKEISSCLTSTVPKNFYDRVEEGSILPKKTQNISFMKKDNGK
ncbi:Flavin-dependent monooxygenase 1-like protein [Theobroma cacao]|uniref:Flavin-dependent monooxygenase 1-like protein n=1 Tax=Theobroma cacao TaxID=3641 RepID=A0A061DXN6_THECC|nr:Flavin-dependent monooxygenase 1-like protein [Theobroma cacao]